jgi:ArsR family transcriptional regulator
MNIYIRSDLMELNLEGNTKTLKAISDPKRLQILNILSSGEKCACEILELFDFTQPTLSHHMKVLMDCGLVNCRKEGLWSHYSLHIHNYNRLIIFLMNVVTDTKIYVSKDKAKCNC